MSMASIVDTIVINNPKFAEAYVEHMEKLEREPIEFQRPEPPIARMVTDPDEARDIMLRGIKNWGDKK